MELFKIFGTLALNGVDKVNTDLDNVTDKAQGTQSKFSSACTSVGQSFIDVGNKTTAVGKKFLPVSLAVQGMGTYALKTAADFDSGMSQVAAVSGATGDDLQALRDKAREMGSKTKFSATEAAQAMNYMAMAGWKTGDMLGGIEGIMNLAAASGEDLATTSDIVTDALTAFGLSADDSGHFADILAAASSNANTNVSMMGETFKYAAPIAGALGYSAEDTAQAIGLMANAGIKGSQAGTSLRTIMTSLTGDIQITGDKLGDVTIATTNADGSMRDFSDILADCRVAFSQLSESEQANTAGALVGKNAMSGFLALMNAGEGDINKLSDAIANCDGTAEQMAETMQDNLAGQMTILKSQLDELAISFGEMLMPVIRKVVGWIQSFVDKLNSMDEGTRQFILTVGLVLAAIAPVLIAGGKLITGIGQIIMIVPKLISGVQTVIGGFTKLFSVLMANPIVLVIAAIAALVAAFIYLWNTNEDFRNFWINLWNNIKEVVTNVVNAVKDFLTGAWDAITTTITTAWNAIKDFFTGIWEAISGVVTTAWETIKNIIQVAIMFVQELFNFALELWLAPWRFIWENFGDELTAAWNAIKTFITNALNAIKTVITNVWNAIKAFLTPILNTIKTTVETVWNAIKTAITTAMNAIKTVITTVWNAIKSTVTSVVNAIKSTITSVWNAIKSTVTSVLNGIKSTFTSIWNSIKSTVTSVINGIKSTISNGINAAKNALTAPLNAIENAFTNTFNNAKNIVSNAINAIKSKFNFSWSLPHLKLPHVSISGSFSLTPPSVPHFSLNWYKKAMDTPYMFTKPTLFDVNPATGTAKGAGEAGDEVMIGKETMLNMISQAVAVQNDAVVQRIQDLFNKLFNILEQYFPEFANLKVCLDSGALVGELAPAMDEEIGEIIRRKERGFNY